MTGPASPKSSSPIVAVAFDLDGTLIESTEAIVECFELTFAHFGDPIPAQEKIMATISIPLEDQLRNLTDRDADECAVVYRKFYADVGPRKTLLFPGAKTALESLIDAGLKLGIATSKYRASAEMLLKHLGVRHLFQSCIGPDDVTYPKPHPEAVEKALSALGAAPGEAFFVGDTKYDVNAAAAAGVRCLGVTTGYATRQELTDLGPEAVLDGIPEVAEYILSRI